MRRMHALMQSQAGARRAHAAASGKPAMLRASTSNQVLQAKLRIGAVDDPLEHEADRAADAVVADAGVRQIGTAAPGVRAKCAECEAEEKTVRRAPDKDEDEEKTIHAKTGPGGPAA